MNIQEQEHQLEQIFSKMREIMLKKGNDYAGEDRLSNFKLAGNISGISPEVQCLSLIATKVARLGTLLNSNNKPNNESIEDSVIDLINYSALLHMILSEVNIPKESDSLVDFITKATGHYWSPVSITTTGDLCCDVCNGLGTAYKRDCYKCKGDGTI